MSSSSDINANFPIPGLTQSSKGFRDNFAIIKEQLAGIENTQFQIVGAIESNVGFMNGDGTTVILEIPESNLESAVVSTLGGLNIATVPWASNSFAFISGSPLQTFNVADATTDTEAVNMQTANVLLSEASVQFSSQFAAINGSSNENFATKYLSVSNIITITSSDKTGSAAIYSDSYIPGNTNGVNDLVFAHGTANPDGVRPFFTVCREDGQFNLAAPAIISTAATQLQQVQSITSNATNIIQGWVSENFAPMSGNSQTSFNGLPASMWNQFVTLGQFSLNNSPGNPNGILTIPTLSGTLYIQYGTMTVTTSGGQYAPFPWPFPGGCYIVTGSDTGGEILSWAFESITRYGCTVLCSGTGNHFVTQFIAIGW